MALGANPYRIPLLMGGMVVVAYFSIFGFSTSSMPIPPTPPHLPSRLVTEGVKQHTEDSEETRHSPAPATGKGSDEGEAVDSATEKPEQRPVITGSTVEKDGVSYLDPPFGYNRKRNVARWGMIYKELAADSIGDRPISVVDYGADEGYFSISTAFTFPSATVIALDMGGTGGSIWSKKGSKDVLKVQEGKIDAYGVAPRVVICQTAAKPDHFFELTKRGTGHDYQFVLSVFHWFTMPDRTSFEEVLVALLKNAKTTFIELPIVGDMSKRFMQQVGSQYFVKWYDGRSDMRQILEESMKAKGLAGRVKRVGGVKWLPGDKSKGEKDWEREVFRVDVDPQPLSFNCNEHFAVYGCAKTTTPNSVKYSKCS
eukprot:Sspe_Gene.79753::Locus_50079_Transcript_1_1_Confidence_1.000_Length_1187::g.79753::m.79753